MILGSIQHISAGAKAPINTEALPLDDRRIWFDRILNDTQKIVAQAAVHELRKHPLLKHEADDLIQDTYMELFKKYPKLRDHENIPGWLVETLKRKTKDRAKKLYRELKRVAVQIDSNEIFAATHSDFKDMPEDTYVQQETSDALRSAISTDIGEDAFRLLEAHYVHKIPLGSLAADNGLSTDALKMRFYRWKKRLREKGKNFPD